MISWHNSFTTSIVVNGISYWCRLPPSSLTVWHYHCDRAQLHCINSTNGWRPLLDNRTSSIQSHWRAAVYQLDDRVPGSVMATANWFDGWIRDDWSNSAGVTSWAELINIGNCGVIQRSLTQRSCLSLARVSVAADTKGPIKTLAINRDGVCYHDKR